MNGYATDAEWLADTPVGIVQTTGWCDLGVRHDAHTFTAYEFPTHISGWRCYGQYADCSNCDDRRCMDCVTRTLHDVCEWDCPGCDPRQADA